jgi:4-hydroxyproline epimerase
MAAPARRYVSVVDSHTAGEPTRVVIEGGPDLGTGPVAERLERFRASHDAFRSAVVNEPRGSDVLVGALLLPPHERGSSAGVIFFNNVGMIKGCGHGTIGLVVTLAHLGRIRPGAHRIETCVGTVTATLLPSGEVRVEMVPSARHRKGATVHVEGHGAVTGDVAWGGNWFFLVEDHGQRLEPSNVAVLTDFTTRIRRALVKEGVTGEGGAEIDHIELFAPSPTPGVQSRNFVLCPGLAYDRSPCGTGTSAKVACLHADGKLKEGEVWRQEGIVGGVFEASVAVRNGRVIPTIQGSAYVTSEARLVLDPRDPFVDGIGRK